MGGIVGEVEFEFTQDASGQGKFVPTGKVVGQIVGYLARDDVAAAGRLYQGCGSEVTAELFREAQTGSAKLRRALLEMFAGARDFAAAARCAEMVDDPARAARLFETAYDFARAGALYRKAGDLGRAALMCEKTMEFAEAGRLYLQIGDVPRAADNLERAGDVIGAARLHLKAGHWKRAGAILHGVPANRAEFFEAGTLLADVLWRTGHRDLAIAKLVEVVRSFPAAPETADLYYRLGEMFAEVGQPERASIAYERVDTIKPGFRDARDRAAEMKRLSRLPQAPAPEAQAPPAAEAPEPVPPLDLRTPAEAPDSLQLVDPDIESLRDLPPLADLERDELRELAKLGGRIVLPAGRSILREGGPGRGLFVVREGEVEVVRGAPPDERVLATLRPGEHFGEMSLLEDAPASATVRSRTDAVLLGIPKEELTRFLYLHERAARKVYHHFALTLARRLAETNARLGP